MARQPAPTQKRKTIELVLRLLDQGKTPAEVARVLSERPGLFPYAEKTIRKYQAQWRKQLRREAEPSADVEISESQLLRRVRGLIEGIEVSERAPRGTTAPGRSAPERYRTQMISVRLPLHLIRALEALEGQKTFHVERAVRLYLLAVKAK
jgi:hypothetical protein